MANGSTVSSGKNLPNGKDRRARPGSPSTTGVLRRLRALLVRPIGLQRQGTRLKLGFIERRRVERATQASSLADMVDELRARLLSHALDNTALVMRHLAFVHDELGRNGWPAVEALPAPVLSKAVVQARMLLSEEPSPVLAALVDQLQVLRVAAEVRADRLARLKELAAEGRLEVSETTHEEFVESERTWVATVPPATPPAKQEA